MIIVMGSGWFMIHSMNKAMDTKRSDHSELSVAAKLPEVEKWINTLSDKKEKGNGFLPWRLRDMSDVGMYSWDSDTGQKWYFFEYDIIENKSVKGYAYCKTENASPPFELGRQKIQCKVISPHWVRFESVEKDPSY
jgi:hypothetical protein